MSARRGMLLLAVAVVVGLTGCGKEEAKKARRELEDAKANLSKLQEQVDATQKSFNELETQYKGVKDELAAAKKATDDVKTQLLAAQKQLASANDSSSAELTNARKQIASLQEKIVDLKQRYTVSVTEQKTAQTMAGKYIRENARLKSELEKKQEEIRQLRGIKPSSSDTPANPANENLPKIPSTAPKKKLPDPTNSSE